MGDPRKNPWTSTAADFSSQGTPDPYGELKPGDWATQGLFGIPVQPPVQPVGSGDSWTDMLQRANVRGDNGVTPPVEGVAAPNAPPAPESRFAENPLAYAAWLDEQDPASLSPAQLSALKRLREMGVLGATPSGGVATATSTTSGYSQKQLGPEAWRSIAREGAIAERMAGRQESLAAVQQSAGDADALGAIQKADQLQQYAAQRQQMQTANAERIERLQAERDAAQKDYEQSARDLDPDRLMHGGKRVMGALAMALGAYGATLGRTQNFAQQIVESALARDFEGQKQRLGAKREAATFAQQRLADNRARFADDNAALEATRADMMGVFASQAESRALKLKGTEAGVQAQQTADNFRLQQQTRNTNAYELEAKTVQSSTTTQSTPISASQAAADYYKEQTARAELAIKNREAFGINAEKGAINITRLPGSRVVDPAAAQLTSQNREMSQRAEQTVTTTNEMSAALQAMRDIRKKYGVEGSVTDIFSNETALADYSTARYQYITALSKLAEQGVIMAHEAAQYEKMAPELSGGNRFTSGTSFDGVLQRIDGAQNALVRRANARLRTSGLQVDAPATPDETRAQGQNLGLTAR